MHILRTLKLLTNPEELHRIYLSTIRPVLEYGCQCFICLNRTLSNNLSRVDRRAHKIIKFGNHFSCSCGSEPITSRREILGKNLFLQAANCAQHSLYPLIPSKLERSRKFSMDFCRSDLRQRSFIPRLTLMVNDFRSDRRD